MPLKTFLLAALASSAVALPLAASAQSWGGDYGGGYGGYGYRQSFSGYPQFRDEKEHIRAEIREGLNEGWLDRDEAGSFWRQLQWVQRREQREFSEHGWYLPSGDRAQIQSSLDRIDRAIDRERDADRGDDRNGGWDRRW